MKTYISIDKRSKKARKEYYSSQRTTWGTGKSGNSHNAK